MFGLFSNKKEADYLYKRGISLFEGKGVIPSDINRKEGIECLVKSALMKHTEAINEVAEMLQWSDMDFDDPNAVTAHLLSYSVKKGSVRAHYLLAQHILSSFPSERESMYAAALLERAAKSDDPDAIYKWAEIASREIYDEYDRGKLLVTFLKRAAELGHIEAQNRLAGCYASGEGCEEDHNEAFKWYKAAAEAGHPKACRDLADIYAREFYWKSNYPIDKNADLANEWYERAKELEVNSKPRRNPIYESKYDGYSESISEALEPYINEIIRKTK